MSLWEVTKVSQSTEVSLTSNETHQQTPHQHQENNIKNGVYPIYKNLPPTKPNAHHKHQRNNIENQVLPDDNIPPNRIDSISKDSQEYESVIENRVNRINSTSEANEGYESVIENGVTLQNENEKKSVSGSWGSSHTMLI